MIDLHKALCLIRPGAQFVIRNNTHIEWFDTVQIQPTEAELQAAWNDYLAEQPWKDLRAERNRRLAETDWVTLQAVDASVDGLGVQLPVLWMTYRQELRDLPANTTDPANPVWPTKPGGAA